MSGVVNTADIYTDAVKCAHGSNQVVGEKSDYYVTLEQLEAILQKRQSAVELQLCQLADGSIGVRVKSASAN